MRKTFARLGAALVLSALLVAPGAASHAVGPMTLQVPAVKGANGKVVDVAIVFDAAPDAPGVGALQVALLYDPQILEPQDVVSGAAASSAQVQSAPSAPGRLGISLVTTENITSAGQVLIARFKVLGTKGQTSSLDLDAAKAWQGDLNLFDIRLATQSGTFTVTSAKSFPWWIVVAAAVLLLVAYVVVRRRRRSETRGSDGSGAVPTGADYVYVPTQQPVVARDGHQIGVMQPDTWYRAIRQDGQWLEVTDERGLTGWIDAARARRQT